MGSAVEVVQLRNDCVRCGCRTCGKSKLEGELRRYSETSSRQTCGRKCGPEVLAVTQARASSDTSHTLLLPNSTLQPLRLAMEGCLRATRYWIE